MEAEGVSTFRKVFGELTHKRSINGHKSKYGGLDLTATTRDADRMQKVDRLSHCHCQARSNDLN